VRQKFTTKFFLPENFIDIINQLSSLEKQHDIKVLYAVESGSRAWGFESKNSDYDVRYIYIHKPDWYLSIDDKKDSREIILPNDIDLAGWEIRKTLKLFRKSNPPLLEWLDSDMIYIDESNFADSLRKLSKEYFNPKSCIYHYLHMANGNYREYFKKDKVKLKRYFYVLRPLLACDWIVKNNTPAPIRFQTLLDSQVESTQIKNPIENLLEQKKSSMEMNEGDTIPILNDFIQEKLDYYQKYVLQNNFDLHTKPDVSKLDLLFREQLNYFN
jgi:predicted nucleotidyltransferase